MGFEIPVDMQDPINQLKLGARLNARQRGAAYTIFVTPATGVFDGEFDAFDSQKQYLTTYSEAELLVKQNEKLYTVVNMDTGRTWQPEKPRRKGRRGRRTECKRPVHWN